MVQDFNARYDAEPVAEYLALLKIGIKATALAKYLGISPVRMSQYGRGHSACPEEIKAKMSAVLSEMRQQS